MNDLIRTVSTESWTQPTVGNNLDIVARIQTSSNVVSVQAMNTREFVSKMVQAQINWKKDIDTLNDVINWQHKVIDFNSSYAAYLLEQISEEEFEQVAESMATDENEIDPGLLAYLISRTLKLTTIEFTPSDLANLFHCSVDAVDEALHLVPNALIQDQPQLQEATK